MLRNRGSTIAPGVLLAFGLCGLLAGCGGASGTPPNTLPVADAGLDRGVVLGTLVALDGSGSRDPEGNSLSFTWALTKRPVGSTAVLSDPASPTPSFRADATGVYELSLVVSDGSGGSASDAVAVTAGCAGGEIYNNAEWIVGRQASTVPEDAFQVTVNGNDCGTTKLLTFASRAPGAAGYPQVLVFRPTARRATRSWT